MLGEVAILARGAVDSCYRVSIAAKGTVKPAGEKVITQVKLG